MKDIIIYNNLDTEWYYHNHFEHAKYEVFLTFWTTPINYYHLIIITDSGLLSIDLGEDEFSKHFIRLAEYREKRINEILED